MQQRSFSILLRANLVVLGPTRPNAVNVDHPSRQARNPPVIAVEALRRRQPCSLLVPPACSPLHNRLIPGHILPNIGGNKGFQPPGPHPGRLPKTDRHILAIDISIPVSRLLLSLFSAEGWI